MVVSTSPARSHVRVPGFSKVSKEFQSLHVGVFFCLHVLLWTLL